MRNESEIKEMLQKLNEERIRLQNSLFDPIDPLVAKASIPAMILYNQNITKDAIGKLTNQIYILRWVLGEF